MFGWWPWFFSEQRSIFSSSNQLLICLSFTLPENNIPPVKKPSQRKLVLHALDFLPNKNAARQSQIRQDTQQELSEENQSTTCSEIVHGQICMKVIF